ADRLNNTLLDQAAGDANATIRNWAARLTGERQEASEATHQRLLKLAADSDPSVRLAAATAVRQFTSGSLTVNTPPANADVNPGEVLVSLVANSHRSDDRTLHFLIWMAAEPAIMRDVPGTLNWFVNEGGQYMPLTGKLLGKMMRRICDTRDEAMLSQAVEALGGLPAGDRPLLAAALEGLIEGQRGKALIPAAGAVDIVARLSSDADMKVASLAQQLGTLWGDARALKASLALLNNNSAPQADRIAAIKSASQQKSDDTRAALMQLMGSAAADALKTEAVRALMVVGVDATGPKLLEQWDGFTPAVRRAVAELATTRWQWKWPFLGAVEAGKINRMEVPPTVIRTFATSKDDTERAKATQLFGKFNQTPAEKEKLIAEKRRIVLSGKPDLAKGHETAKTACRVCHKLHGEGADIGPDLTGVGRSTLDALLANVITPNQIIGAGYENVVVETKDGRSLSGRLVEETDSRIKLVNLGPTEFVIGKEDIKTRTVSEMSLMPEGLENLPDEDFRDMIWYILAPPQDGPLTDEKRRELIGAEADSASTHAPIDGESVALWNPDWRVIAPEFEGTPKKHPEYGGRKNVLETHPFDDNKPSALERVFDVPAAGATLTVETAAHERGDWELRIFAQGEVLKRQLINRDNGTWQTVTADLGKFAGKRIVVRLENMAGGKDDWSYEFGYWGGVELKPGGALQASR
ncbi:MAG TPA: dehydrogenase, partial [Verrucomicrobiales bacterium]|nr:dehydrogenase [Verrucomicrobiales bacterium]